MRNVVLKLDKAILTITVDLTKSLGPSKSGKTTLIASTDGPVPVPGNEKIKVGLNIYT